MGRIAFVSGDLVLITTGWNEYTALPLSRMMTWSNVSRDRMDGEVLLCGREVGHEGDDLLRYGKLKPENNWWLDLENVDGVLRISAGQGGEERHNEAHPIPQQSSGD